MAGFTSGNAHPLRNGHLRKIIVLLPLLATAAAGCHSRPFVQGSAPDSPRTVTATLPLDQLYVLESSGAPAADTSVTFLPGRPRTVVLRHGPPDNTVFVELVLSKDAVPDSTGDSVHLSIGVRPGVYGVTITSAPGFVAGAVLKFKYPVHFVAPAAASAKYGNPALFEQALAIAVRQPDSLFRLLPSTRPAADNLEAPIPGPGVYIVAAPR